MSTVPARSRTAAAPDPAAGTAVVQAEPPGPADGDRPLRVALLSYRSKPHCGGQGIYLRHLSRELAALGHQVEVFSGQPYPELEPGPVLRTVPSLDLYADEDPFRTPGLREYRDWIDVLEVATMWTGAFPEPLTFSLRALRELRSRRADFDVVHDNQVLAYGMLGIPRLGLPLVTSIHHPISVDRRIELAEARGWSRLTKRRWYSFVRMQGRVARRVGPVLTGSQSSRDDICRDFGVPASQVTVIPLGVDTRLFHPRPVPRVPGRVVAVASADSPVKGVSTLLRAFAKVDHRAGRGTDAGRQADAGRADGPARPGAGARRPGAVRHRDQRRGPGRAAGQRGGGRGPVALRGLLAAGRGAHGVGHAADRDPDGRAAGGHRGCRGAGHAGRRRRSSGARCGPCSARRPNAPGWRSWPCGESRSGSRGPPWPGPPSRNTGAP